MDLSSSTMMYLACKATKSSKIMPNNNHYANQGNQFCYQSKAHMPFPVSDKYKLTSFLTPFITNRKSNTSFRLVPTSMTLNGVIGLILRFFTDFGFFDSQICHSGWQYQNMLFSSKTDTLEAGNGKQTD